MCCIYYKINIYWYQYEDSLVSPSSSRTILVIDEALMCYCLSQTLQNVIKRPFRSKYLKSENAIPGGLSLTHV